MWNLLLGVLTLGVVTSEVVLGCRDGWATFQGSCYLFANHTSHYTDAEHFCSQHGSHLVHIETADENRFLTSAVAQLKAGSYWIGLTDLAIADTWKWMDTNTELVFNDWFPGQPNKGTIAHCATLYSPDLFQWVAEPCFFNYHPICESSEDVGLAGK